MNNKGYAKFWGATKVHYWRCANSVFKQFGGKHGGTGRDLNVLLQTNTKIAFQILIR